jgi:hypothetical protein
LQLIWQGNVNGRGQANPDFNFRFQKATVPKRKQTPEKILVVEKNFNLTLILQTTAIVKTMESSSDERSSKPSQIGGLK